MTEDERALQALSEALANGTPVDWKAAEEGVVDDAARRIVRDLKSIAGIAAVHSRESLPHSPPQHWGTLQLLERVGGGAYGEVYRAWDTHLDREVALKLVPANRAPPDRACGSVLDEGRMLARLRHPNVVAVYGAEQIGDRIGLWMEFVRGQTLEELVANGKHFDDRDVIDIGLEICQAMAAVHGAGLLHRDIKAHNVTRAADGRVVLMDFGAGRDTSDSTASDLTGTPLYLAPEVLQGKPATAQSDVYSLGVLLYYLACGSYPVQASSLRELRLAHERGDRTPLRTAKPTVGRGLARVIERASSADPARRHEHAEALAADLAAVRRRPNVVRAALVATAATGLAAWMVWTFGLNRGEPSPLSTAQSTDGRLSISSRPSVFVLGFRNDSADADGWLPAALLDAVIREIRANEHVGVAPHDLVGRLKGTLGFVESDSLPPAMLSRIRTSVGSAFIVLGTSAVRGVEGAETIQLDVRVQDTPTGASVAVISETVAEPALLDAVARIGARLRRQLGGPDLTAEQRRALLDGQPASVAAFRAHGEAVRALRQSQPDTTMHAAFEHAMALDPTFAMNHEYAGYTWARLGDEAKSKAASARAAELAANLSREERLYLEYRSRVADRETRRDRLRVLLSEFPNTDYGLLLLSLIPPHDHRAVFDTIEATRKIPGALENPRLDLREANAALLSNDLPRARKAAAAAAIHAAALGDSYMEAEAKEREALSLLALGEPSKALVVAEDAELILTRMGTSLGRQHLRGLWPSMAHMQWAQGNLAAAADLFDKSIAASANVAGPSADVIRSGKALMLARNGELAEAATILGLLLTRPLTVQGELRRRTDYQEALGTIQFRQGRFAEARTTLDQALVGAQKIGAEARGEVISRAVPLQPVFGVAVRYGRQVEADVQLAIARLLMQQGDLTSAGDLCDKALAIYRAEPGAQDHLASALTAKATVLLAKGDIPGASALSVEAAAALRPLLPLHQDPAIETALGRSALARQERRFREAYRQAEIAAATARTDGRSDHEVVAYAAMALAALGDGQLEEARQAADRAEKLIKKKEDRLADLTVSVAAARVKAATKSRAEVLSAISRLDAVRREATRIGALAVEFDARFALAEIELESGRTASGRARFAALERDASSKGFRLAATRAGAAASGQRSR